jgi:hypothetical protein
VVPAKIHVTKAKNAKIDACKDAKQAVDEGIIEFAQYNVIQHTSPAASGFWLLATSYWLLVYPVVCYKKDLKKRGGDKPVASSQVPVVSSHHTVWFF